MTHLVRFDTLALSEINIDQLETLNERRPPISSVRWNELIRLFDDDVLHNLKAVWCGVLAEHLWRVYLLAFFGSPTRMRGIVVDRSAIRRWIDEVIHDIRRKNVKCGTSRNMLRPSISFSYKVGLP